MLANRTNMNSVNTNGKNFMPSVPAVLRTVLATNSYDISATDCSRPGTTARRRRRADEQRRNQDDNDQHEQRGIGEIDLIFADRDDRDDIVDLKLVDGIDCHGIIAARRRASGHAKAHCCRLADVSFPWVPLGHHPAERITLKTPAAKPSKRNTMNPQGEMPSKRSMSQPRPAPTSHAANEFAGEPEAPGVA